MKRTAFMKVASMLVVGSAVAAANALMLDARILIERAMNSPTLTVRYSGASTAVVELRLNGVSLGTRTVSPASSAGETAFNLDLSRLVDGDNEVEVRLFDRTGKLVGSETTIITAGDGTSVPVRLTNPRMGSTVQGPVEVRLGFGREMRNVFVSFFVNNEFRSMTNYPPYTYLWDTTREPNGWHELEAWVVDDASSTMKTRRIRVFVNNPGGRTDRRVPIATPVPSTPSVTAPTAGAAAVLRDVGPAISAATAGTVSTVAVPSIPTVAETSAVVATVGASSGLKTPVAEGAATAGPRLMTPSVTVPSVPASGSKTINVPGPTTQQLNSAVTATGTFKIAKGQRVPNIGSFAVLMNGAPVNFDVQPRVEQGVPLTPFRHLMESAGGEVTWENATKTVDARTPGRQIFVRIGDRIARINDLPVELELTPFIESGRTIVPLSFITEALDVEIEFDAATGHVLITNRKK